MDEAILSIDVGYGGTKYTLKRNGMLMNGHFRSLTPRATFSKLSDYDKAARSLTRKTATITVDNFHYEIGPGVFIDSIEEHDRTLNDAFPTTPQYRALVGGVFTLEGIRSVELLVLGLPIHTIDVYGDKLVEFFKGTQDFGHGPVEIRNVAVVPQPLGSLYYAGTRFSEHFSTSHTNVIVDVGYYSTDWIVAKGFELDTRLCAGKPGGASHVYDYVARRVREHLNLTTLDKERIDDAIMSDKPYRYQTMEVNLSPFLASAVEVIAPTITELKSKIRGLADARCIMLTGGGGKLYSPALQAAFPALPVHVMPSSVMANSVGFYVVAEQMLRNASLGPA